MSLGDIGTFGSPTQLTRGGAEITAIIEVRPGIFAVLYGAAGVGGVIETYSVNSAGVITYLGHSLTFEGSRYLGPAACLVSTGIIAVTYGQWDYDVVIITLLVNADGSIQAAPIDSLLTPNHTAGACAIVNCGIDNIYATVHTGSAAWFEIITYSITPAGMISDTQLDVDWHDQGFYNGRSIIALPTPGRFVVCDYTDQYSFSFTSIYTDGAGNITPLVDRETVVTLDRLQLDSILVGSGAVAGVYCHDTNTGKIITYGISAAGIFVTPHKDLFTFPDVGFLQPNICLVGEDCYVIAYRGPSDHGIAKTILISTGGMIGANTIDAEPFDSTFAGYPFVIHVSGDIFLVGYTDTSDLGQLKTVPIVSSSIVGGHHEMLMKIGP